MGEYTTKHGFLCEYPHCHGIGEHLCMPELLIRIAEDPDFAQAVWEAHLESVEIEFESDFEV